MRNLKIQYIHVSKTTPSSSHIFFIPPSLWLPNSLDLNPVDYAVWGSYKSVCTSTTGSRTWKSCTSVSRRNGTVWTRKWLTTQSVNDASDWQPVLQPAKDILNFTLNITAFVHTLINMFWTLLTLLSVKQINLSWASSLFMSLFCVVCVFLIFLHLCIN